MKTVVKKVSPAWAAKQLKDHNTHNRNMSQSRVDTLATDMRAGNFILTHQGIAFDEDGTLVDGQHRLAAVVKSGVTVEMLVTTGLPRQHQNGVCLDVIDVVDSGCKRSIGQQLTLVHDMPNGNKMAAAAKVIATICHQSSMGRASLSTAQTLKILGEFGDDVRAIRSLCVNGKKCPQCNPAGVYGTLAFCRGVARDATDEFTVKLATLEQIPAKSPVMALYRRLQGAGTQHRGQGSNVTKIPALTALAVMKYAAKQSVEFLRDCDDGLKYFRNLQKSRVALVCDILGASHQAAGK